MRRVRSGYGTCGANRTADWPRSQDCARVLRFNRWLICAVKLALLVLLITPFPSGLVHAQGPDLQLTKTGPTSCKRQQNCKFTVVVTNVGDEPFDGYIEVKDRTPQGMYYKAPTAGLFPPWTCSPPSANNGVLTCGHEKTIIEPGESLPPLSINGFHIDADSDFLFWRNKAELDLRPEYGEINPENNSDTVDVKLFQLRSPGTLHIAKTADNASCPALERCGFTISLTNVGPGTFNAEIVIQDFLSGGTGDAAQLAVRSSGWSCGKGIGVTGRSWLCKRPKTKVAEGSTITLKIDLIFSEDF